MKLSTNKGTSKTRVHMMDFSQTVGKACKREIKLERFSPAHRSYYYTPEPSVVVNHTRLPILLQLLTTGLQQKTPEYSWNHK